MIKIKGRSPNLTYACSLKDIFQAYNKKIFLPEEIPSILEQNGFTISQKQIEEQVLNYREFNPLALNSGQCFLLARPYPMKEVLDSLLLFNFDYQDTVVKIAIEESENRDNPLSTEQHRNTLAQRIFHIISIILHTGFYSVAEPLYYGLTNIELDYIVIQCMTLSGIQTTENQNILQIGMKANSIAKLVQTNILKRDEVNGLEQLLPYIVYSGVTWWSNLGLQQEFLSDPEGITRSFLSHLDDLAKQKLAINDLPRFTKEVIEAKVETRLIFFLDDNGELVWDLYLIRFLLQANPLLNIICVTHVHPISNTANQFTINTFLETYPETLSEFGARFQFWFEPTRLAAFDLRYISASLMEKMLSADIILTKGVSNFELFQCLPVPIYYMFTVYSNTSVLLTGLDRYSGIFARMGPGLQCYGGLQPRSMVPQFDLTLKRMHDWINSDDYQELLAFYPETELNQNLCDRAKEKKTTFGEAIKTLKSENNRE